MFYLLYVLLLSVISHLHGNTSATRPNLRVLTEIPPLA